MPIARHPALWSDYGWPREGYAVVRNGLVVLARAVSTEQDLLDTVYVAIKLRGYP